MRQICFITALAGIVLVSGCDKQTKLSVQEINALTQKMFAVQAQQARELAGLKAQLAVLPVQIDKTQLDYFVKSQEKALFYQTNALFLLLAVDKKIQSQFEIAAEAREAATRQAFVIHTNETELALYCTAQITAALAGQEKRILETVNGELQQASATLGKNLTNLVQQLAADKSDANRLNAIEADLARIQRDLALIAARLGNTNQTAGEMR